MNKKKKGISERAIDRLEENGYLMSIRAEMKAEVMKCLVEMEDQDEIPPNLRIKRYTPTSDESMTALAYVEEFMKFHGLENSLTCLKAEVNAEIPTIRSGKSQSKLAEAIMNRGNENDLSRSLHFRK